MKLIVGLGNPGEKYKDTRHNVGFMVADKLARELGSPEALWKLEEQYKASLARAGDVILCKPQTFMNASGVAVRSVASYYKIKPADIWVIHDDLDLPLGKIRIRTGGGSAGHNGIESLLRELGSDAFVRFRLGIGRGMEAKSKSAKKNMHRRFVLDFVLSRFTQTEAGEMKHLVKHGVEAVRVALFRGIDRAMNRFN
jgi:PTH1 family peptidyl-tRNA hydrolase